MASKLYNYLATTNGNPQHINMAPIQPMDMMQKFNEFSKTVNDPKAEVEKLLADGKMSQEQFNILGKMATGFMGGVRR